MADVSITPANVVASKGATTRTKTAGAAIDAGDIIYIDPADNRFKLADADAEGIGNIRNFYMALNTAAVGQPVSGMSEGEVTLNAALTAGVSYYLSPNAGAMAPRADVLAGDNVIFLGIAKSTTVLVFKPLVPGVTLS